MGRGGGDSRRGYNAAMSAAQEYRPHLALAHALADRAREIVLPFFHAPQTRLSAERKADRSPVTQADRQAEQAMRAMIADAFPEHGVIGEEFGGGDSGNGGDGGLTWCIDPIDGTRAFLSGRPTFGTLIALLQNGEPVLGIVDMPRLDERWVGVAGEPTLRNGEPCRALAAGALADATLLCTSAEMFGAAERPRFDALRGRVAEAGFGTDCYGYALLASGFVDIVMEAGLAPYDFAALVPVVEGAGGCISDWSGAPLAVAGVQKNHTVLACAGKELHALALAAIAR